MAPRVKVTESDRATQCGTAEEVDYLFEQYTQQQYYRDLLFSTVVNLMSLVVYGICPPARQS